MTAIGNASLFSLGRDNHILYLANEEIGDPAMRSDGDDDRACYLVGRFLFHFSSIEVAFDEGIRKLLELDPDRAQIVTANMDFVRKLNIVRSAIELQSQNKSEEWKRNTKDLFKKIHTENDSRQIIAHSSFSVAPTDGVKFNRTIAKDKLNHLDPIWTEKDFSNHFEEMRRLRIEVRNLDREIAPYRPSLDFSDPRNSGYIALLS